MAGEDGKKLSKYQEENQKVEPKEFWCGINHETIDEALTHALTELGLPGNSDPQKVMKPYLGTMRGSEGIIVGSQISGRRRFRLDFDPGYLANNQKPDVKKGTRGVHINEEDFDRRTRQKICHPTNASLQWADLYWNKWSKAYGIRGLIKLEDLK